MSQIKNHSIGLPSLAPQRLRSWLQHKIEWSDGARLQDVRLNRLWVGRHGRLSFELALDLSRGDTIQTCLLQGGGLVGSPQRSHTHGRVSRYGLKGLRLISNELGLWCCTPDRDRRLPVIRALIDDKRAASVLAATAAAPFLRLEHDNQKIHCEITAYRAGKRCSLRAWPTDLIGCGGVFLKVFHRAPTNEQVESWRQLPAKLSDLSHGRVRAPSVIDFCPSNRMLISAAVTEEARPLETDPDAISMAAHALAVLHDLPVGTTPKIHTPGDEFQTVCRWVRILRGLEQDYYLRLRNLAVELSGQVTNVEEPGTALIHRDFFAAQLLRSGDTLWVLDFDTLCLGHPEVDVATFVAHLFLDGLVGGEATPEITRKAESFVDAYRQNGGRTDRNRLRFYLPCALARLGAIHSARNVSAEVVEELWRIAEDHLAGSLWLS